MGRDVERWWADHRGRECDGKVRHPTQQSAEQAARLLEIQTWERYSVYRCAFCRRWHVGSGELRAG